MSIAFCTHCSDDWFYDGGCSKLINSAKHFHPDIPFFVFGSHELAVLNKKYDGTLHWCNLNPVVSKEVARFYDKVVHFDADSFILGSLDSILDFTEDIALVRNNNDHDTASRFHDKPVIYNGCSPEQYANAGLIGSNSKSFWDYWIGKNYDLEASLPYREQDVLNHIIQEGKFTTTFLDPKHKPLHYGISSLYGKDTFWDSAKEIKFKEDKFYLKEKEIKVWHQAGGSQHFPKLQLDKFFTPEVCLEMKKFTEGNSIYEKIVL
jgi:hypothetical protein